MVRGTFVACFGLAAGAGSLCAWMGWGFRSPRKTTLAGLPIFLGMFLIRLSMMMISPSPGGSANGIGRALGLSAVFFVLVGTVALVTSSIWIKSKWVRAWLDRRYADASAAPAPQARRPAAEVGNGLVRPDPQLDSGDGATIVLTRGRGGWRDLVRSYIVMLDGQQVGMIKRGRTIQLPLSTGHHEVFLRIDWCRSPAVELDAAVGEVVNLYCEPGGSASGGLENLRDPQAYIRLARRPTGSA